MESLTIKSFYQGLKSKKFSATEIIKDYLKRIEEKDKEIGAYLTVFKEEALKEARFVDSLIEEQKDISFITGLPLAIKDNILIKGFKTTAASKILENYIASYDATVIKKLKKFGAIFLGKTNLDEFAMGSSTENSAFLVTKNPFDLERVPGGSSGGSAAAVAADLALAALGSDTGGSIRQPAAFCGVVGLKPTYGAVSRFGLIAMASSLDQIGPITKTVGDAAILFEFLKGKDENDSTTCNFGYDFENLPLKEVKKLKIGLPKEYFENGLSREVEKGLELVIERLKKENFSFREISLAHTPYALSVYYIIMPAEVSTNLARYDGLRYSRLKDLAFQSLNEIYFKNRGLGFGQETRRRILLGTFVLSAGYYDAYYSKAQKVRRLIKQDFDKAFEEVDIILTPVTPTPAFKIGEKVNDPLSMYLSDIFTIPVNLAGLPALALPVKKYSLGGKELPVAFQLIGKLFQEADILSLGCYYESLVD